MDIIVDSNWLESHINDESVRIIDVRFSLQQPSDGYEQYEQGHIPGAIFLDVDKDLSDKVGIHGGRHPLPPVHQFIATLEQKGISNDQCVVIYDQGTAEFASRCWWLLTFIGFENVKILDGGYATWIAENKKTDRLVPSYKLGRIVPAIQHDMHISYEDLKEDMQQKENILIDAREKDRYLGLREPIDKKAGHIPGAIHHFWKDNFVEEKWKNRTQLETQYSHLPKEAELVVYCGSGITAAPNFIGLKLAGFPHVKLYAGSFSDWISYDDNKIESEQGTER